MKFYLLLAFVLNVVSTASSHAQTHLATRGTDQLAKENKLFSMQQGVDYRVVGTMTNGGGVYIETSIGAVAFPNPERFRVLSGGVFATDAAVVLHNVEAVSGLNQNANWEAKYSAELLFSKAVSHVYVAFQWYVDGEAVATTVQTLGSLKANDSTSVSLSVPLTLAQKKGTYSFHVYSGYLEVKQSEMKKGAAW